MNGALQPLYQCDRCSHLWVQPMTVVEDGKNIKAPVQCEKCGSEYMVWINYREFAG